LSPNLKSFPKRLLRFIKPGCIFSEGELRSEDGTLLAKATGTFKLLYPKLET